MLANEGDGEALAELAPELPASLLGEALDIAQNIEPQIDRMEALAALAPLLPDRLLGAALRVGQAIGDNSERDAALVALASHMDETSRATAIVGVLRATQAVSGQESRM